MFFKAEYKIKKKNLSPIVMYGWVINCIFLEFTELIKNLEE